MTREDARKILETKRSIIATLGGADDWVEALDVAIRDLSVPEAEKEIGEELLTADERADVLNAVNDIIIDKFNLVACGYEDTGVFFKILIMKN